MTHFKLQIDVRVTNGSTCANIIAVRRWPLYLSMVGDTSL